MSRPGPEESYCLVTLDSCRYDTARRARRGGLRERSRLHRAFSQGTYTWPSHLSMMVGLLPNVHPGTPLPLLNRFHAQLFQLEHRPTKGRRAEITLQGITLPEGFRNRGHSVLGLGAVGWFGGRHEAFWAELFGGNFAFTGIGLRHQLNLWEQRQAPQGPYFFFLNVGETHLPYATADTPYPSPHEEFAGFEPRWDAAPRFAGSFPNVSAATWRTLRHRQVEALEWVDGELERLWERLPRPVTVIVVADHGDCLGEDGLLGHGFYHPKVMEVPMYLFRLA
jgi:hypothetical protein